MVKKIAVYGTYRARIPVRQQVWRKRKDGRYQRYWIFTDQTKTVERKGRYEFHGKGKDLYKAVVKAHEIMPKGFVDVSAEEFLRNPEKYGFEGSWIEKDILS